MELQDASSTKHSDPFERQERSPVWKCFRRDISSSSAVCLLCNATLTYKGGTTTGLHRHITSKHPSSLPKQAKQEQLQLTGFLRTTSSQSAKPVSAVRAREITDLLSRWVWLDARPMSIVGDQGLRELMSFVEPGYTIPSRTHLTKLVRKQHQDGVEAVKNMLKDADNVALTTDIWTSHASQAFATTTAHFIAVDGRQWTLRSCVLETVFFPGSHTAINIAQKLRDVVANFEIRNVVAIVHDQAANAERAGENVL